MKEIRWHGRGGDGAFTAAKLLGLAASVFGGKYGQAFPSFGPERRGAPVLGFTRISDEVITDHSQIYTCDCVIVLDDTLCDVTDVFAGMKAGGTLVINTTKSEEEIRSLYHGNDPVNVVLLDATSIALEELKAPIVNTIMLGAAMGATEMVQKTQLEEAIDSMMAPALREKNKKAMARAYDLVKGGAQG
ncbi:2-oxoacid:acceptor oxidoreductase family protein [Anaerotignum lactatifermentans]|uniref:2-oxoacid:acceptor oxidoreductase family protein n=1 Tax=Anaerotignum lactatifermentans TaxID=160404 RepID=A0ABS2GDN0_9FIRM|nr:2-oxoacid:acceptor oxidoreductase family protein [Anaerotignum lactatifermentans]MBM6830446.1 2-oxoacid:acceptor oxidoreductase family protein [Anaerotignum lactatifermentans]MBM6878972.1 2-oxoacid:acceptor oxidoreductase family protein [Anaerotignum lactatifermentans]MBM6952018.1 2-oxoacid:acceptor oxidoreductase family protein [Anaerotignum lactatifermentans]